MTNQERHNPSTGSGLGRRVDLDLKIKQKNGTIVKKGVLLLLRVQVGLVTERGCSQQEAPKTPGIYGNHNLLLLNCEFLPALGNEYSQYEL